MLLFDLTSSESFEYLSENFDKEKLEGKGCVLIATKSDLEDNREVQKKEAFRVAGAFGCPYFEVSSLTGELVYDWFWSSSWILLKNNRW